MYIFTDLGISDLKTRIGSDTITKVYTISPRILSTGRLTEADTLQATTSQTTSSNLPEHSTRILILSSHLQASPP